MERRGNNGKEVRLYDEGESDGISSHNRCLTIKVTAPCKTCSVTLYHDLRAGDSVVTNALENS